MILRVSGWQAVPTWTEINWHRGTGDRLEGVAGNSLPSPSLQVIGCDRGKACAQGWRRAGIRGAERRARGLHLG